MRLRGHHLICSLGFRGKGYDERFTAVMQDVLYMTKMNPDMWVKVVDDVDILCSACPNRKGEACSPHVDPKADQRIKSMDHIVIQALDLELGKCYQWSQLQTLIAEKFDLPHMNQLCASCEWRSLGYCDEGLQQLKKKA